MLPFLFSLGLPALAPSIGLGALSTPVLSGIGAGLGSFLETGDVGKGIKTGLLAGLSGRLLGGIGGGVKGLEGTASRQAMMTPTAFGEAAATAGLKAPQPEGGPRRDSFCARMKGMKKKLTSAKTANDPNSRINKSLRAWKC